MCRILFRPKYLPIVGRYVDHQLADISVDISVAMSTDTSRWINRASVDRYIERHIGQPIHRSRVGQYVDRYVGRGVHKVHMVQFVVVFNYLLTTY